MPTFLDRRAQRVFTAVIRATPPGASRPWRTARSLATIKNILSEGISEGDLLAHVAAAGELVRRHREEPRWWSIGNLFGRNGGADGVGGPSLDIWRSKVAEMEAADERIAANEAAEIQRAAESQREADEAPAPEVRQLALHRLIAASAAALTEKWDQEADDDARDA